MADRVGHDRRYSLDAGKLNRLGWKPQVPFERGLADTVRWYAENEAWWRPQMWLRRIPIVTAAGKREMH